MFIKLTKYERGSDHGDTIYSNPLTITAIRKGESYTNVNTVDGGWYKVAETPEEIMSQVESVTKYYLGMLKGETY